MKGKKFFLYGGLFSIMILITYFVLVITIDFKTIIAQEIKTKFPNSSYDNINVTRLPIPKISINNLSIDKEFNAKQVDITISVLSILKLSPYINKLNFSNSIVTLAGQNPILNHYDLISKILDYDIANEITFDNVNLANSLDKEFIEIKNLKISDNSIYLDRGGDTLQILRTVSGGKDQIDISSKSQLFDFALKEIYDNNKLISGDGEWTIKNATNSVIKFNIESDNNINNIKVTSDLVSGLITLRSDENQHLSVDSNIQKLDLTLFQNFNPFKTISEFLFNLNLDIDLALKFDQIKFREESFINNSFSGSINNGYFTIQNLSGSIDSGGDYKITGNTSTDLTQQGFSGEIIADHSDIVTMFKNIGYASHGPKISAQFHSEFVLNSSNLSLQNLNCNLGEGNINGDMSINNLDGDIGINSKLTVNGIDLDNYSFISGLYSYFTHLFHDIDNSDYFSRYIPIRELGYSANISLLSTNMTLLGTLFDTLNINFTVTPNIINIHQLYFKNSDQEIDVACNLNATSLIPSYGFAMTDSTVNLNSNFIELIKNIDSSYIQSIINKINFEASIGIKKLTTPSLEIDDLNSTFSSKDNSNVLIDNSTGKIGDSSFTIAGHISTSPISLNIVYGVNNFEVKDLLSAFGNQISGIEGKASMNGKLALLLGLKIFEYNNPIVTSNFVANTISVNHYSPDDFIMKIADPHYDSHNLNSDQLLINANSSNITNIQGSYSLSQGLLNINSLAFNTQYSSSSLCASIDLKNNLITLNNIIGFYRNNNKNNDSDNSNQVAKIGLSMSGALDNPKTVIDLSQINPSPSLSIKN